MFFRSIALWACFCAASATCASAAAQADRGQAIAALRAAASSGDCAAQLALASLLDQDGKTRNDEALGWYEKAARSGSPVAQRRYLDMLSRPAPKNAAAALRAFTIRLPKSSLGEDGQPPDIPPGYHCHPLGNRTMWCHGATDGTP